jgi:murein DD-endopeptidase MepM/ murein hydrolase activator NlpD
LSREVAVTAAVAGAAYFLADRLLVRAIDGWVWPVPTWRGRESVISDTFKASPTPPRTSPHLGVDLMFRRRTEGDMLQSYPVDGVGGSRWHFMPPDVPVVAARGGRIWSAGIGQRGWSVVIDHGPDVPYATFYQHLSRLLVGARAPGAGGPTVAVGQPIGIVGGDPSGYKLRHLHFELWEGDRSKAFDPQLVMKAWGRVTLTDGAA